MMNAAQELAEEYLRLGGKRLLVMDDNILSTNSWEADPPEAEQCGDVGGAAHASTTTGVKM